MYGLAIRPMNDKEAQKVSDALHTAEAEDPSLVVEHNASLNEVVLRGHGEIHLRSVLEQIKDRYSLEVQTAPPSIAYRETITAKAEGHHRHKKQTGGAGQFGEVYLRVEPLPSGSGFEFKSEVVGGAIPSQYIPAVETGVKQVMDTGAKYGFPMQDIKVIVYDGKHHSVDSKEIAFVQAGKKAFLDAVDQARPIIMEPIVDVTFTIPSDCAGGVTGDLSSMRGIVSGTETLPDNRIRRQLRHGLQPLRRSLARPGRFEASRSLDRRHCDEQIRFARNDVATSSASNSQTRLPPPSSFLGSATLTVPVKELSLVSASTSADARFSV
jgi:elongation factor G